MNRKSLIIIGVTALLVLLIMYLWPRHPHNTLTPQERDQVHAELKAIDDERIALLIESTKAYIDCLAGRMTIETALKIITANNQRTTALMKRQKALQRMNRYIEADQGRLKTESGTD